MRHKPQRHVRPRSRMPRREAGYNVTDPTVFPPLPRQEIRRGSEELRRTAVILTIPSALDRPQGKTKVP